MNRRSFIAKNWCFRTLDPGAVTTSFVVWNDTHENAEPPKALHALTGEPDEPAAAFIEWRICGPWRGLGARSSHKPAQTKKHSDRLGRCACARRYFIYCRV